MTLCIQKLSAAKWTDPWKKITKGMMFDAAAILLQCDTNTVRNMHIYIDTHSTNQEMSTVRFFLSFFLSFFWSIPMRPVAGIVLCPMYM